MKKLLLVLPLLILIGCSYENTPMQAVVDKYKTDEVKEDTHSSTCFIVRDTNGAVWYVETEPRSGGYNTNGNYEFICIRNTLLFSGIKKVDYIKIEE